jgi:subtilisin family serine protease
MVDLPDRNHQRSSSVVERLFRVTRPLRPEESEDDRRTAVSQAQLRLVVEGFGAENVGGRHDSDEDDADDWYLCHSGRVLVQRDRLGDVDEYFARRTHEFDGTGNVAHEVGEVVLYELPARQDAAEHDIDDLLAQLDEIYGEGVAAPDHIVYLTPNGGGQLCPATEPQVSGSLDPVPGRTADRDAGRGVRISVVDTGWFTGSSHSEATPWLSAADGEPHIEGDEEVVDPAAIHPYAGHGTFAAGIIRCLAPQVELEIEGVLTTAGAVFESDIVRQLTEAMGDRDEPDIISIQAGAYTRGDRGLPLLERFLTGLRGRDEPPLVIAAAGNNSCARPFFPAAYEWAVGVGATNDDASLCDFTNYGGWVDVYAHGRELINAFPTGTYTCYEPPHVGEVRVFETGLAEWSGTSFSTPVVSGAVAAYMSKHGVTARQAVAALVKDGVPLSDPKATGKVAVGPPHV